MLHLRSLACLFILCSSCLPINKTDGNLQNLAGKTPETFTLKDYKEKYLEGEYEDCGFVAELELGLCVTEIQQICSGEILDCTYLHMYFAKERTNVFVRAKGMHPDKRPDLFTNENKKELGKDFIVLESSYRDRKFTVLMNVNYAQTPINNKGRLIYEENGKKTSSKFFDFYSREATSVKPNIAYEYKFCGKNPQFRLAKEICFYSPKEDRDNLRITFKKRNGKIITISAYKDLQAEFNEKEELFGAVAAEKYRDRFYRLVWGFKGDKLMATLYSSKRLSKAIKIGKEFELRDQANDI